MAPKSQNLPGSMSFFQSAAGTQRPVSVPPEPQCPSVAPVALA